uniref:Hyphally-regulated cell wall protein N-terminal domain-containing protein n=1 Tax=Compsopogon caeruleus TaxID=31354 RepID=A0A7S1THU9_9RHOD|mmetsp:Transcript_4806/g.9707  ORF Transcript_4806/g.9707 Transcript_4806/m.9707 type:complete len:297 (+) Transcript_4806:104-994(+)
MLDCVVGVMWLWVCGVLAQPPDESTPCVAVTKGTEVEDGMHVCVMETTDYDGLVFERDLQNVRIDGIRGTGIFANVHFLGTLQSCAIGPVELNGFQSALLFNETVMDTTIDSILGTAKSTYAIFRNDIMRCSIGKIETKLYDGGVSFDKIEDSFVGPITTYGDYSPAWFFGEIRGSQIGAIQIHETVALSDSSYLGLVYFRQEITSSVIESIWVKAGSPNPTVIFGMNASISNSSVGDISVDGGNVSAPASIAFLNSSISKSRIGNLCTSGSGTSYVSSLLDMALFRNLYHTNLDF